jgi:hypothetical protein
MLRTMYVRKERTSLQGLHFENFKSLPPEKQEATV